MNKPAPKEPSMDEILSSIRQIIADDDAAVAPRKPSIPPAAAAEPAPVPRAAERPAAPREVESEPLALTREQMLEDESPEQAAPISFSDILGKDGAEIAAEEEADAADLPPLVDPEDITFDSEEGLDMGSFSVPMEMPEPEPKPKPAPAPAPRPSLAQTASMPDPTLSSDMAERLLEPTTDAAVKHTFAKLSGLSLAGSGQTIDALLRDLLRPMLKEWLDDNLPAIVERMVEKEIARISRGVE